MDDNAENDNSNVSSPIEEINTELINNGTTSSTPTLNSIPWSAEVSRIDCHGYENISNTNISKRMYANVLENNNYSSLVRSRTNGDQNGPVILVAYEFHAIPLTITIDCKKLLNSVPNNKALKVLNDKLKIGSFFWEVTQGFIKSIKPKSHFSIVNHKCSSSIPAADVNDFAICNECIYYHLSTILTNEISEIKEVNNLHPLKTSYGLINYAKLFLAKLSVIHSNRGQVISYVPECVSSKIIAHRVMKDNRLVGELSGSIKFKGNGDLTTKDYIKHITLSHISQIPLLVSATVSRVKFNSSHYLLIPSLFALPLTGPNFIESTRIKGPVIQEYEVLSKQKFFEMPNVKIFVTGMDINTDVGLYPMIVNSLVALFSYLVSDHSLLIQYFPRSVIDNDSFKEFLNSGSFKVIGNNNGIGFVYVSDRNGRVYDEFVKFYTYKDGKKVLSIAPLVAIMQNELLLELNQEILKYFSNVTVKNYDCAITWVVQQVDEVVVFHYPNLKIKGEVKDGLTEQLIDGNITIDPKVSSLLQLEKLFNDLTNLAKPEKDTSLIKTEYTGTGSKNYFDYDLACTKMLEAINIKAHDMRQNGRYFRSTITNAIRRDNISEFPSLPMLKCRSESSYNSHTMSLKNDNFS